MLGCPRRSRTSILLVQSQVFCLLNYWAILLVDVSGIEPDGGATSVAVAGYPLGRPTNGGPDGNCTQLHHARDWLSALSHARAILGAVLDPPTASN